MRGEEERIGWSQVSGVEGGGAPALKGSKAAKGTTPPDQLTLLLRNGGEVAVDLSGLSDGEKAKVVAFVQARLKR